MIKGDVYLKASIVKNFIYKKYRYKNMNCTSNKNIFLLCCMFIHIYKFIQYSAFKATIEYKSVLCGIVPM